MFQPKNIIDKIWDYHVVTHEENAPAVLGIDLQMLHEVTSPQPFAMLRERGLKMRNPRRSIATIDHSTPTHQDRSVIHDPTAKEQVELHRKNVHEHGITFYDFESGKQGIVHVIAPELGITQPGMTIVCGDSHTSTHGAFGAIAFGIGITEVGIVMASGCILQDKPKTMKVHFTGQLSAGVFSKDMILALIQTIGIGGANGHIIEFTGEAIKAMSMEARMSLCNMSIECGARAGVISPDQTTFEYIQGREYAPVNNWDAHVRRWKTFATDAGALYDTEVEIDVSTLAPMVTWGVNPAESITIEERVPQSTDFEQHQQLGFWQSIEYTKLQPDQLIAGTDIDMVFLGSCTNGRIEDLRIAAGIMQGNTVHSRVRCLVVPGSEMVEKQMIKEGLDQIFRSVGVEVRRPGCSMCIAMNGDKVPPGQRCMSTSNRNFMNRQGKQSITHLCSPATAAASALAGKITDCRGYI